MNRLSRVIRKINKQNITRGIRYVKKNGFFALNAVIKSHVQDSVHYHEWFMANRITPEQLQMQKGIRFAYQPLISLLVPAYHTPIKMLEELLESVQNQSYENWELCIAVGSADDSAMKAVLERYHSEDERIQYRILTVNKGISENTNEALAMVKGEFVAPLDHDDLLEPDALFEVVKALQDHMDIVYTDEDKVNAELSEYSEPNFKPDFSIDLLRSQNYITHLFVVRTEILQKVGGFRKEFDGAQDYDVILRCIEQTEQIAHVPKILYHWRMIEGSTAVDPESKMYCYEAGKAAIQQHLKRLGIAAEVEHAKLLGRYHVRYELVQRPTVTVVIASAVTEEDRRAVEKAIRQNGGYDRIEFIYSDQKNPAAAYNSGAEAAHGEYLLFINGRIQLVTKGAVREMLGLCMLENVGAVGTKIRTANHKITDAGLILGYRGAVGHAFRGTDVRIHSYMNRAEQNGNYSAVSGDVLMTSKALYEAVGGFVQDEDWEYAQVQFCRQLGLQNRRIVFHGFAEWCDYQTNRNIEEREQKQCSESKWEFAKAPDPFYNINMTLTGQLFTLDL